MMNKGVQWTSLCVAMVMLAMTPDVSSGGTIPVLFARGSHYEVGEEMGQATKHLTQQAMRRARTLKDLSAFNKTEVGRHLYTKLMQAAMKHYPQYVDELRGFAAGAGVSFHTLFLWTIAPDLDVAMGKKRSSGDAPPSGGCSDFMVRNQKWALHVHSEDIDPDIRYLGYIWMVEIVEDKRVTESFISFHHAGNVPGSTWSLNAHGLMISGNILFLQHPAADGAVPRRFRNRALLTSSSIKDLVTRLESMPGLASGYNFMVSERTCSDRRPDCVSMAGIEVAGDGKGGNTIHVHNVTTSHWHFNEYRDMMVDQKPDDSSRWRRRRMKEYEQEIRGPLSTLSHMKHIISDQKNRKFPFFRDGAPPDYLATASIAIADHYNQKLYIYKNKPTKSSPDVTFHLRPWIGRQLNLEEIIARPDPETQTEESRHRDEL